MKRFLTVFGLIAVVLIVFVGLVALKLRADRPEVLIDKLRGGTGDKDVVRTKLGLARGDVVPLMIGAFQDGSADLVFRADMLDLLFKKYRRSSDERILPVLRKALESPKPLIRKTGRWSGLMSTATRSSGCTLPAVSMMPSRTFVEKSSSR